MSRRVKQDTSAPPAAQADVSSKLFGNARIAQQDTPTDGAVPSALGFGPKRGVYITGVSFGSPAFVMECAQTAFKCIKEHRCDYVFWEGHPVAKELPLRQRQPQKDEEGNLELEFDKVSGYQSCNPAGVVDELHKMLVEDGRTGVRFVMFNTTSNSQDIFLTHPALKQAVFEVPGVVNNEKTRQETWNNSEFVVMTKYSWFSNQDVQVEYSSNSNPNISARKVTQVVCDEDGGCGHLSYAKNKLSCDSVYMIMLGATPTQATEFEEPWLLDGKFAVYREDVDFQPKDGTPRLTRCSREPTHMIQNHCIALLALHPLHEMAAKPELGEIPKQASALNESYKKIYQKLMTIEQVLRHHDSAGAPRFTRGSTGAYSARAELGRTTGKQPIYQWQVFKHMRCDVDFPVVYRWVTNCFTIPQFVVDDKPLPPLQKP